MGMTNSPIRVHLRVEPRIEPQRREINDMNIKMLEERYLHVQSVLSL